MNILAIFDINTNRMTSIEDRSLLNEGQTEFVSNYSTNPELFNVQSGTTTQVIFDAIANKAGTRQAPVLIESNTALRVPNLVNVYIENGSLKIAS